MAELQTFDKSFLEGEGRILVKIGAPWCGPCQAVAPTLEALLEEGYTIYDVNVDEDPDTGAEYRVRTVPTFIVFENGQEVRREVGQMSKQALINLIEE
jgi:thioredoxin 1